MTVAYKTDSLTLKKLMLDRGITTILQLSSMSGINRNTLSHILDGKIQPSAVAMKKLVATLMIPPEQAGQIFFGLDLRNR